MHSSYLVWCQTTVEAEVCRKGVGSPLVAPLSLVALDVPALILYLPRSNRICSVSENASSRQ
jgi:hypothetical protein